VTPNGKSCLFTEEHIPLKARFPVVDAHNHLWGQWDKIGNILKVMDECGIVSYCDLTSNISLKMKDGGYELEAGDFNKFLTQTQRHPGRFFGFTTATFNRPADKPLFEDAKEFVKNTIQTLNEHVKAGAKGLKILKELGLHYRDSSGELINFDDERLAPIWEECARLGVPVLAHQSDPCAFFESPTLENEHFESLKKYYSWSFADKKFPRKSELLERRDRVVKRHPDTIFMLPHVANFAENLEYVSRLLEENSNVYIDISARLDELGRQPYTAREFMLRWQDRIYFGADMPASLDMYRSYFRFLETFDEHFIPPDYDGSFDRFRWRICGIGLPDNALKKIYHQNILKIVPSLKEYLKINS